MNKEIQFYLSKDLENRLKSINKNELENRIRAFEKLNPMMMSQKAIQKEIDYVFNAGDDFSYKTIYEIYPKGRKFYRVRKLEDIKAPNKQMSKISDFWNPPEELITKYGRLNKPHESLLYMSFNPYIAIQEMNIKLGDSLAIIVYESKAPIKVTCIGADFNYDEHYIYDKEAILIHEMYNDFLKKEFAKEVPAGKEHLYIIPECIAKYCFDSGDDGWRYLSMRDNSQYNVCLKPKNAKKLLNLHGAMIGKYDGDKYVNVSSVTHGFNKKGEAQYYEIGSKMQKLYFPDL